MNDNQSNQHIVITLAMVGGLGFTLIVLALGIGVVQGEVANNQIINGLFFGGILLMIASTIAWTSIVQPHRHFDDINQPLELDTHHEDH